MTDHDGWRYPNGDHPVGVVAFVLALGGSVLLIGWGWLLLGAWRWLV